MDALFSAPIGALLIFALRLIDVAMAIMRMILAVRGHRGLAATIGFFEVIIWLFAAGYALRHLDSWLHIVGYAGGFASGTYVGVWLEGRFALGVNVVRAIIPHKPDRSPGFRVAHLLREHGYVVTEVLGQGQESTVDILLLVVRRKDVPQVLNLLRQGDPDVFVSVEDVRSVQGGVLRPGGRKFPFLTRT